MTLRRCLALLVTLPALLLPATATQAGKFEFRVTGVNRSDVLNIRERVDDQATITQKKILGQIPAGSGGVYGSGATIRIGPSRWYEVRYRATRGWVNGRYLEPVSSELESELSSNLFCGGTEPFWALKIGSDAAELTRPDAPPAHYTVAIREPFQGRRDALAMRLVSQAGPAISALVNHKEWCSDGMSDLEYAFEVRIIGLGEGDAPLHGCCSLLR